MSRHSVIKNLARIAFLLMLTAAFSRAADVKVRGLSAEDEKWILDKLAPRLEYILSRPATKWRADDTAFFLKRVMIKQGYNDVVVEPKLSGEELIEIFVKPGVRYKFGEIRVEGDLVISREILREYFMQPIIEAEEVSAENAPYIGEYVTKGERNITNYLRSLGYWNAEVTVLSEEYQADDNSVDIVLSLFPEAQLTIAQPQFIGADDRNIAEYLPTIKAKVVGKPASSSNINQARRIIENYYAENGFQLSKVKMQVTHTASETRLTFTIDAGAQYRVNEVRVIGHEKTKPRKVRRYYQKERGEFYNESEVDRLTTRLINTGAFRSVIVKPVPLETETGLLDLEVTVSEAKARLLRSYLGFGSFEGGIIGAGYSDNNFLGSLTQFYAGAEYSGRGLLGHIGINEQRLFNSPLDFNLRLYLIERFNEGYDVGKLGLESNLIWEMSDHFTSRLYWNAEYASSSSSTLSSNELGPDDYFLQRLGFEQTLDFRNNDLLPVSGYHGRALIESGYVSGDASTFFLRADLENSIRYYIDKKNQLLVRLRLSALHTDQSNDLPIDARLFSGGVNSQRAYQQRELGPRSLIGNDPIGGEAFWVGSVEFIRPVVKPLQAVIFADAGQLYQDLNDFSFSDPSLAAGLGLRIDLPIGPVRLEYGRNLNRKSGEPSGTFHFSIGASF